MIRSTCVANGLKNSMLLEKRHLKTSARSYAVLPWGVYRDDRSEQQKFNATVSWPTHMRKTVRECGIVSQPGQGTWRSHVGVFGSASDARDALEAFIHELPSRELKTLLFA